MSNTILVVDDEKMITEVLSNLIKTMLKCEVVSSNNPVEALGLLKTIHNKVDIIISDFLMPTMNGIEFLKKAKEICPEAILIFLTGYADKENAIRGINEVGIYQYLQKPWDDEALISVVKNGLEKKEFTKKIEKKNIELLAANNELEKLYILMQKESQQEMEKGINIIATLVYLMEQKDKVRMGHSYRVSQWCEKIAEKMALDNNFMKNLKIGSILHDIGKFTIPNEILYKTGKLTDEEKVIFESHPVRGEEICKPLNSFKACLKIIKSHHELLNGKGYPEGLSGQEIPLEVRIVTVADIFDSNYSIRANKDGLDLIEMNGILQDKVDKDEIDAVVVAAFWAVCSKENLKEIYANKEKFEWSL